MSGIPGAYPENPHPHPHPQPQSMPNPTPENPHPHPQAQAQAHLQQPMFAIPADYSQNPHPQAHLQPDSYQPRPLPPTPDHPPQNLQPQSLPHAYLPPQDATMTNTHNSGGMYHQLLAHDHSMVDAVLTDEDICMEDTPNPKRRAVTANRVHQVHDPQEYAREKAKSAVQERNKMAGQLAEAQTALAAERAALVQERDGLLADAVSWQKDQLAQMKADMQKMQLDMQADLRRRQEQLDRVYQERLQNEKARNVEITRAEVKAENAARQLEMQQGMERLNQEHQREKEMMERDMAKRQAEFETNIAAFNARNSTQRLGPRSAATEQETIPQGPPPLRAQYTTQATRDAHQVGVLIRENVGRYPGVNMTPTQPAPVDPGSSGNSGPAAPGTNTFTIDWNDPRFTDALQQAVAKATREQRTMGVRKSSQRRKRGVVAEYELARNEQQKLLTQEQDLDWKKVTNIFWHHWSGRDRAKDWVDYLAETEATSLKCTAGGIQAQASSKFYFGSGWQTCLWNKQLLELLVKHTLEKRAADPNKYNVPDVSHGYLMALYYGSLKEAHAEWSRQQPRGGETTHDARVRAAEYNTKHRERNIGNSRKQAKFKRRISIASKMIRISGAKGDANGVDAWTWLRDEFLGNLQSGGMSSEEDEIADVTHNGEMASTTIHGIKICPWCAKEVNSNLMLIDGMATLTSTTSRNARMRARTETQSETFPPIRLPREMYNADWLAAENMGMPEIEKDLEITDGDFMMMVINEAGDGFEYV
ncbi:hypothetical protein C8F04DRAFT_1266611 [Mycena alexandri]|uniref:Uncharacterized protein n=1 Tax=Mycena alexandri TaxID=1745969 RepID=A0AAD6SGX7_9AGAR|nr:hypothetical protein C8F04DRAFT_1266611 [Mycena alexandri]